MGLRARVFVHGSWMASRDLGAYVRSMTRSQCRRSSLVTHAIQPRPMRDSRSSMSMLWALMTSLCCPSTAGQTGPLSLGRGTRGWGRLVLETHGHGDLTERARRVDEGQLRLCEHTLETEHMLIRRE